MANVTFDEEQRSAPTTLPRASKAGLNNMLQTWGWAKDDAGAERVLLFIAGAAVLIALGVSFFGNTTTRPAPSPSAVIQMQHQFDHVPRR